jgi:rod shape-determining protein MreC
VIDRKTIRRRRAVLALLVTASLALLSTYFSETTGGFLHAVQRGVLEVVAPVQKGASLAFKPFRDAGHWVGDTLHAKSRSAQLEAENGALQRQVTELQVRMRDTAQLSGLARLQEEAATPTYQPVLARVIERSPTVWSSTITIDKGRSDGVELDQPVVGPGDDGGALVGKVTAVTGGAAQVTLITDQSSGVSAKLASGSDTGVVKPAVGDPSELLLQYVSAGAKIRPGARVVTAGSRSGRLESLFPPGIPVGIVTRVDPGELELYERIHLRPLANLRRLDFVQVLTRPHGELRAEARP